VDSYYGYSAVISSSPCHYPTLYRTCMKITQLIRIIWWAAHNKIKLIETHTVSVQRLLYEANIYLPPDQWRLLRGGRNGVNGMASNTWKPRVSCIWYHPTHSTPAITTSTSYPVQVPTTSCAPDYGVLATEWICFLTMGIQWPVKLSSCIY
jgi:hypothetical protein